MTVPDLAIFEPLFFCVGVAVIALGFVSAILGILGIGRESGETLRAWISRLWHQ